MATNLIIVLSETAPISIDPELWPYIASADSYIGNIKNHESTDASICVREHADGRRVVYCQAVHQVQGKTESMELGGWLLNETEAGAEYMTEQTVRAIRRCDGIIRKSTGTVRKGVGFDCIADLPPTKL